MHLTLELPPRLHQFKGSDSKALSLDMAVVILAIVFNFEVVLVQAFFTTDPSTFLDQTVIDIVDLFLMGLIALEILENTTVYI